MLRNKKTILFGIGVSFVFGVLMARWTLQTHSTSRRELASQLKILPSRSYKLYGQTIPLHELEEVPDGEVEAINEVNSIVGEFFQRQYLSKGPTRDFGSGLMISGTRRGVHPKAHGCLRGKMTVSSFLNPADRVGIFQEGAQYPISVRFSNAGPRADNSDETADSRGIGIKVHGINGKHIIAPRDEDPYEDLIQSFTMNSSDTFFADSAENYKRFMQIALLETGNFSDAGKSYLIGLAERLDFSLGFRVFKAFKKIQSVHATNPLGLQYFSITAFQHGAAPDSPVVKYSVIPCEGPWVEDVDLGNSNFLRANLKRRIGRKDACFKFMIQHRTDDSLSVEDPTKPWDKIRAPFREVATLTLPKQELMDERFCEAIVINPWNALLEHKPVGGINRLRLAAYLSSIDKRKETNRY